MSAWQKTCMDPWSGLLWGKILLSTFKGQVSHFHNTLNLFRKEHQFCVVVIKDLYHILFQESGCTFLFASVLRQMLHQYSGGQIWKYSLILWNCVDNAMGNEIGNRSCTIIYCHRWNKKKVLNERLLTCTTDGFHDAAQKKYLSPGIAAQYQVVARRHSCSIMFLRAHQHAVICKKQRL